MIDIYFGRSLRIAAILATMAMPVAIQANLTPDDCVNTLAITETPDGVLHDNLYRSALGMYCWGGVPQIVDISGEVGRIVTDGDKIYVYDPLLSGHTYTWMEGELQQDGKVVVRTPQLVMGSEEEGWREFLMNVKFDEATSTGEPDMVNTDIVYSYIDGTLRLEEGMPGFFEWDVPIDPSTWEPIGDTPQWVWSGYADITCEIRPFDSTMQQPPAAITLEDYQICSLQGGVTVCRDVKLGIIDGEVWVSGLEDNYPDAFVKGTLENGTLTFETQFICLDETAHLFQFLLPARAEIAPGESEASSYAIADKVELKYDETDGSFTAARDEVLFVNGGTTMIYALSIFESPVLRKKFTGEPAAPADPVVLAWTPYMIDQGFGAFAFALPQVDVNGNPLDTANMFYVLYDGDDEIDLDPELFPNVTEYMLEIPYDWWCYDVVPNGPSRTVYFYFEVDDPGVRLSYELPDGSVLDSEIVYATRTGIDEVKESLPVSRTEYFDLNGRRMSESASGIIVKRTIHADGSVKVEKQLRK